MNENDTAQKPGECFCMGAGPEFTEWFRKMGPAAKARDHFRTARLELLRGIRSLIDERIESLESRAGCRKGTRVSVE